MRGWEGSFCPRYISILTLYRVTNLHCKINFGDKFVLYLINSFLVQSSRGANHKCHFVTPAPDEKTCEKSGFQGHLTGYREMGEAHHLMSTAGKGSEQPISAGRAKPCLSSLPVERSVVLKVLKYAFPLSSTPRAVGFLLCRTRVVSKEKIRYLGELIVRTGLLV